MTTEGRNFLVPTYKCTYRDGKAKLITDVQTARDRPSLKRRLRQNNYYPISIEDISSHARPFFRHVFFSKEKEVAVFARQLSTLISSGVVLTSALQLLVEHTKHPFMKNVLIQIESKVSGGGHFWEALSEFPKVFSTLFVSMVKAGETGGHLEKVVAHLADYTEGHRATKDTLISIAVYPVFLLVVGLATLAFILGFVFPRILFIFDAIPGQSLPLATKILISISAFLSANGLIILLIGVVGAAVLAQLLRDPNMRFRLDAWIYRLPVIGELIQKIIFVRFAQIFGLILSNGISVVEALEIASGIVHNAYVAKQLEAVKRDVFQGGSLSNSLIEANIFSPLMTHVISTGEETGALDNVLQKVSESYDREVKEELKRMINLLEPTIILFIALGVGFIVTATLLPIFQMNLQGL